MKKEKFITDNIYKPMPAGIGFVNAIKYLIAARKSTFWLTAFFFKLISRSSKLTKYPVIGQIYKFLMMFSPYDKRYTQCVAMPFNIDIQEDLSGKAENIVLPIDMMKKLVTEASYRLALDKCVCRMGNHCSAYPHDIACIFMGEGAKITEQMGLGRQVTAQEAEAIIDRAGSLGLVGQTMWVEVEQFVWGWRNEKMDRFLEICFCCPCCCTALKLMKNATIDIRSRWKSAGWQADIDDDCANCGKCIEQCPQHAIAPAQTGVTVDHDVCIGCGLCKQVCPCNAVKINLTHAPKSDLKDYFVGLDIKI